MRSYTAGDFQSAMHGPDPRMEELAYLQVRLEPASVLIAQSQPLAGTVFTERGSMEVEEAAAAFEVGRVLFRFGTWVVTEDGIACIVHHYPLATARLHEGEDWASLLAEQSWVNLWDLLRAIKVAHELAARRQQRGPQGDGSHPS